MLDSVKTRLPLTSVSESPVGTGFCCVQPWDSRVANPETGTSKRLMQQKKETNP
jgi:hypothetical protein